MTVIVYYKLRQWYFIGVRMAIKNSGLTSFFNNNLWDVTFLKFLFRFWFNRCEVCAYVCVFPPKLKYFFLFCGIFLKKYIAYTWQQHIETNNMCVCCAEKYEINGDEDWEEKKMVVESRKEIYKT